MGCDLFIAAGLRTPFAKVDGPLAALDAIELSVPVVQAHARASSTAAAPDFVVWGTVVPNLTCSNIAREVLMDAGAPPTIPAFSTVMACSTSMIAAIEAAGMLNGVDRTLALVGGAESMSRVQLGLGQSLSDWIRRFQQARSLGEKVSHVTDLRLGDVRLYIPAVSNRTTGKSMGEHTEITAQGMGASRARSRTRSRCEPPACGRRRGSGASSTTSSFPSATCKRDTIPRARHVARKARASCRRRSTARAARAR